MKERILKNWTIMRVVYVVMGGLIITHSIVTGEWPGILFGGYFAAMGVFSIGCAAGTCNYTRYRR